MRGNCPNKLRLQPKSFPKTKKKGEVRAGLYSPDSKLAAPPWGFPKRLPHLYSTAEPLSFISSTLAAAPAYRAPPSPTQALLASRRAPLSSLRTWTPPSPNLPDDVQYNPATCRLAFRASTRAATCVLRASALSAGQRCLVIRMTRRRVGQPGAVERRFVKLLG
jgi:hypothetical protein